MCRGASGRVREPRPAAGKHGTYRGSWSSRGSAPTPCWPLPASHRTFDTLWAGRGRDQCCPRLLPQALLSWSVSVALRGPQWPGPRLPREALVWLSLHVAQWATCALKGSRQVASCRTCPVVSGSFHSAQWRPGPPHAAACPRFPSLHGRAMSHCTGRPHPPCPPAALIVSEHASSQDPAFNSLEKLPRVGSWVVSSSALSSLTTVHTSSTAAAPSSSLTWAPACHVLTEAGAPLPKSGCPVAVGPVVFVVGFAFL